MSQTADGLRREIAAEEEALRCAVVDLEAAAMNAVRPKSWIRDRPLLVLAGGILLGYWVGGSR